jgi:hypothetical protein
MAILITLALVSLVIGLLLRAFSKPTANLSIDPPK